MWRWWNRWLGILGAAVLLWPACDDSGGGAAADSGGNTDAAADGDGGGGSDATADAADADGGDSAEDTLPDLASDLTACLAGTTVGLLPAGASVGIPLNDTLSFSVEVPAGAVASEGELAVRCLGEDIVPEGFIALSAPLEIDFVGRLDSYARVSMPFDAGAVPEGARPSALQIFLRPRAAQRVLSPPAVDLQENMTLGFAGFRTRYPGVYQLAMRADAGQTYDREWQYRAITGVSMGANGASMIGLRHPDTFDIIAPLGGPTDWTYLLHYLEDAAMGGFGLAPDFDSPVAYVPDQEFEHTARFDEFWFDSGEGTGGNFNRGEYLSILQDLAMAFGNIVAYSPDSPLLPPGVDRSELLRDAADRCPGSSETVLTIASGFYDDEYNPDGDLPVIMFCDGTSNRDKDIPWDRACDLDEDGHPDEANEGLYPGPSGQDRPVTIAWAVDVDGDGQRDAGEPVIRSFAEPWQDVGTDGLASADEAGFDAEDNPDPGEDDYDYYINPGGTEGNWLYDEGEPYDDVGLDGVADTPQLDDDGYDFGEGNETFDYNPNLLAVLLERDQHHTVHEITQAQWDNLTIYMDAGIRDLFNFAVATNQLAGQVQSVGGNMRIYDGFHALANLDPDVDDYRFDQVDYADVGQHVYVRYGDPEATAEEICLGDGKHVGPPPQIANRLLTLLGFIVARFPGGDFTQLTPPYPTPNGTYRFHSEALGMEETYSILLPPGHERTACTDLADNDHDGWADGADTGCEDGMDNDEADGRGEPYCNDGLDNDQDGLVDAEEDTDCQSVDDTSEWPVGHPLRDARFPVVYLLHGYGQTPDDLRAAVVPFAGFMGGGTWQKVIVVYPDGFCGENERTQCNDGIDNDHDNDVDDDDAGCAASDGRGEDGTAYALCADGVDNDNDGLVDDEDDPGCLSAEADDEADCVQGNFYTNHQAWPDGSSPGPAFEDSILELVDHVDAVYRTRAPETHSEIR